MRNLVLLVCVAAGLSTGSLHAAGFQEGNLEVVEYLDAGGIGSCTGYFADLSLDQDGSDIRLIYANHCDVMTGNDVTENWSVYTRAKSNQSFSSLTGAPRPSSYNQEFTIASFNPWARATIGADVVARKSQNDHSLQQYLSAHPGTVLKPAKSPPAIGEALIAQGYPRSVGPKALRCSYMGTLLTGDSFYGPSGNHAVFSAFAAATCDMDGRTNDIEGMSGGPLLNIKGEVVGTITAAAADGTGKAILEFSPLNFVSLTGSLESPVRFLKSGTFELDHVLDLYNGSEPVFDFNSNTNSTALACFDENGLIQGSFVQHVGSESLKITPTATGSELKWGLSLEHGGPNTFGSADVTCK